MTTLPEYGYAEGKVSNSMLQDYLLCRHKARMRWEQGFKPTPNLLEATLAGTIVHETLEKYLNKPQYWLPAAANLVIGNNLISNLTVHRWEEYLRFVESSLDNRPWLKAPSFNSQRAQRLTTELAPTTPGGMLTPAGFLDVIMVALIKAKLLRTHEKFGMFEREVQLKTEYKGVSLVGTADLFQTEPLHIADYKTGNDAWYPDKLKNDTQFNLYAYMTQDMLETEKDVTISLIDLRNGQITETSLNPKRDQSFLNWLDRALDMYHSGAETVPVNSSRGCPCYIAKAGRCPYKTSE